MKPAFSRIPEPFPGSRQGLTLRSPDHGLSMQVDSDASVHCKKSDIAFYVALLRHHRHFILTFTLLVTIMACAYVVLATPLYDAFTLLLIEPRQANVVKGQDFLSSGLKPANSFTTQLEILHGRAVATRVVEQLGLTPAMLCTKWCGSETSVGKRAIETVPRTVEHDPRNSAEQRKSRAVTALLNSLTVSVVNNTTLARISFESANPAIAARIPNAVAKAYIDLQADLRLRSAQMISAWADNRLSYMRKDLRDAEKRLIAFMKNEGIVTFRNRKGFFVTREQLSSNRELVQARLDLQDTRARSEGNEEVASDGLLEPAQKFSPFASLVRDLQSDIDDESSTIDQLANHYGPKHPRVLDAHTRLKSMQSNLDELNALAAETIAVDQRAAQIRVRQAERQMNLVNEQAGDLDVKKFRLKGLEQEVRTKLRIFESFNRATVKMKALKDLTLTAGQIIDPSVRPLNAAKPQKLLAVALMTLSGIIMAFWIVLLRELCREAKSFQSHVTTLPAVSHPGSRKRFVRPKLQLFTPAANGRSTVHRKARTTRCSFS